MILFLSCFFHYMGFLWKIQAAPPENTGIPYYPMPGCNQEPKQKTVKYWLRSQLSYAILKKTRVAATLKKEK